MQRRSLLALAAISPLMTTRVALAKNDDRFEDRNTDSALKRFLALPGTKSYLIQVGEGGSLGRFEHNPNIVLFTASTYKTFVLGQYLRATEDGLRSEDDQLGIDDSVRDLGSPVFIDLTGTTTARSVLEGMISHSDNTATNAATVAVGSDKVRELIASAGLQSIRIPDTTRLFASYLVGAPPGVDLGWPGIKEALQNPPGPLRPFLNDVITLAGNASDFVSWYEQVLSGTIFAKSETVTEFKRIQGMSEQIVRAVPPDTPAYAKGGEVRSDGFNAKSFAGQIVVGSGETRTPVTFCFVINWDGPASDFPAVETAYFEAIKNSLAVIKRGLQ